MQNDNFKIAAVQMNVGSDKKANLAYARQLIAEAVERYQPDLIALPEMFDYAGDTAAKRAQAEALAGGETYETLRNAALQYNVFVHGGSFHEWREDEQRISNTTVAFNRQGEQIALYRKLHLFDIVTPSGVEYLESAQIAAGNEIVTYDADGLTIGCAICYDLRFPDLFQALRHKNADVIVLPSAFTRETGRVHWDILLKARAIETQTYLIAPAQTGQFMQNGKTRFTHGHSLIVDPWGQALARSGEEDGVICSAVSHTRLSQIRAGIPVDKHRRFVPPALISS